jgi:hypothetical protein
MRARVAPDLEGLLEIVGRHVYGRAKVRVEDSLWIRLRDYDLIHGSCSIQNRLTTANYFPGLKLGVAGFHTSGSSMIFSRFSPSDLTRRRADQCSKVVADRRYFATLTNISFPCPVVGALAP